MKKLLKYCCISAIALVLSDVNAEELEIASLIRTKCVDETNPNLKGKKNGILYISDRFEKHLNKLKNEVVKDEKAVYVGTNTEYAKYWEYGTGKYAEKGGRQGFWVFVPGSDSGKGKVGSSNVYTEAQAKRIMAMLQSQGIDAHMTEGIQPVHMLKRALEDNKKDYIAIFEKHLNGE